MVSVTVGVELGFDVCVDFARSSASVSSDSVSLYRVRNIPNAYASNTAMRMNYVVGPMNVRASRTLAVPMPNMVWQDGCVLFFVGWDLCFFFRYF